MWYCICCIKCLAGINLLFGRGLRSFLHQSVLRGNAQRVVMITVLIFSSIRVSICSEMTTCGWSVQLGDLITDTIISWVLCKHQVNVNRRGDYIFMQLHCMAWLWIRQWFYNEVDVTSWISRGLLYMLVTFSSLITARDFFFANLYPSGSFTCIFCQTSPQFFLC